MTDHRLLMVPDGVAGERIDAGLAKMFGLSRTRAAELIADGRVQMDSQAVMKSDRLVAGAVLGELASRRPFGDGEQGRTEKASSDQPGMA